MKKEFIEIYFPAILACFLWGTATPIVKLGIEYESPMMFAGKRFILASVFLMILVGNMKFYIQSVIKGYKKILFVGFVSTIISSSLFYTSVNMIPASIASVIVGSQPVFVAIISHFFGVNDKLNIIKLLSFLLGLAGILIISFPSESLLEYNIWGIIMLIIVNIAQGVADVYVAKDKTEIPPRVLTSAQILFGGIVLLILSSLYPSVENYKEKTYIYYSSWGWLSVVSATSIGIWFYLIKTKKAVVSKINIWKFLVPVFGVLISWIILDEPITQRIIFGMIIVVLSIIILGASNIKLKNMKKLLLFTLPFIIFSCSENQFKVNISKIDIEDIKVERFENDFYNLNEDNISKVKKKYSVFFNESTPNEVWINKAKDSLNQKFYTDVKEKYSDISWLEKDLTDLFKHIKYYFPKFKIPKIYTYLELNDPNSNIVYIENNFIAIPINLYMGEDYIFYSSIDEYLKRDMKKEMIVRDIAIEISKNIIKKNIGGLSNFVENSVFYGKIYYLTNHFIPNIEHNILFGFDPIKLKWAEANKKNVWTYFIKNNILYSTSNDVIKRFIDVAPFSKFYLKLDQYSPGRIGTWFGYNIVLSYSKNNTKDINKIINTDNLVIFKKSKYKP